MAEKLLPCPFCGRTDSLEVLHELGFDKSTRVECECGGRGAYRRTAEQAITTWNTRADAGALATTAAG